jgi:hypothetical protein
VNASSSADNLPSSELPASSPRNDSTGYQTSIALPGESKVPQAPGTGQLPPAGHDSPAIEVPERTAPVKAQDKRPTLNAGFNPVKWRRRIRSYAKEYASWDIGRRNAVMEECLPNVERKRVTEAMEGAIRSIASATVNFTTTLVALNYITTGTSVLLFLAAPVVAFLLVPHDVGIWVRIGAAGLALAINYIWRAVAALATYQWIKWRSPQRAVKPRRGQITGNPASAFSFPLIIFLLLLALIPAVIAGLPSRLQDAPSWLRGGWLHTTFGAAAWVFGVWALISIGSSVFVRINWSLTWRRISSQLPEHQFIDRITGLIASLSANGDSSGKDAADSLTPLQYVHVMEDISRNFEQYWPRHLRTGYPHIDLAARIWARQVTAAIRAEELPVLLGQHRPVDTSIPLIRVVAKVISKDTFTESPQDDRSYRHAVWWRRLGRPVLAVLLLLSTVALVFFAAWQPGLPEVLKNWGLSGVASAMSLPSDLRPGVLAAAVAIFGLFVRVIAPDKPGGGEPTI